jgi:thioredoxin reductase
MYDVMIVGGGPAGLSAALILGRCRRRVLVCDLGKPRNAPSRAVHGFLTCDGTPPLAFLEMARRELAAYDTVEYRRVEAMRIERLDGGFRATLATGDLVTARKVLLATGVIDEIPPVKGVRELYGASVFHCPYCDAWEVRDQPLAVYGRAASACRFATELTLWSHDVVLCPDGAPVGEGDRALLDRHGVRIASGKIRRLEGRDGSDS